MKLIIKFLSGTFEIIFIVLFLFAAIFHELVSYGIYQGIGQLSIVWNARPIEDVMYDPAVADSVKSKLRLVEEVKKFAVDTLGLAVSKNYTTLYDQHGKPILWVLTGSEKYMLKPVEWWFPVVGSVSYKGFFKLDKAKKEEQQLIEKGFDTDIGVTGAWSTLGWFRDPILSNVLGRSEGQVAELFIHEMTHATLYVKSSVDFNENFASAIGEVGAEEFLKARFGDSSEVLTEYLNRNDDYNRFASHMLRGTKKLDSLYHSSFVSKSDSEKNILKEKLITEIIQSLDTVSFKVLHYNNRFDKNNLPNNSYFLGFTRYDAQKGEMKKELRDKYNGNIRKYIEHYKQKSM